MARTRRLGIGALASMLVLVPSTTAWADTPREAVAKRLKARGHSAQAVAGLHQTSLHSGLGAVRHARFEQSAGGLRVHGAYVRAALDTDGRVINLIDRLVEADGPVAPASISAATAERAAGGGTAEAVAIARGASLREGFVVETWDSEGLRYTLVDGDGAVLEVESRTNSESYNVFAEDPDKTAQSVQPGASWLSGSQLTTHISGPNAQAYLDVVSNNSPDPGGTTVTDGNFLTAADLSLAPSTTANRNVAVQNLFYLTNRTHDILEGHGFDNAAGNFEGTDPVLAEAQDGGGVDNANFSTPADGTSPRMQMYLWNSPVVNEVVVGSDVYDAGEASFGPAPSATGIAGSLAQAADAVAPASDACTSMPAGSLAGRIALIDRGGCDFVVKVRNAQNAGASAALVVNSPGTEGFEAMGGRDRKITIPSAMLSHADGQALLGLLGAGATVRKASRLMLDASLDSDIVYHEYGHGLTWRMIGGMSGPFAGAIGEGAGDTLAMFINGDDRIAEYSAQHPVGIRRDPYDEYPRTYSDVTGSSVHDDGEIYAAIAWDMTERFADDERLFDIWVDGMNYTPATPKMETMRDGMLASIAAAGAPAEACLVWRSFARYGVGVGASGSGQGRRLRITESFAVPAGC